MSEEDEIKDTFTYRDQITEIVKTLQLSDDSKKNATDRAILKNRFLSEVLTYEGRRDHTKRYYNVFRFMVTTGSILLPAILSIGQMDPAKLPPNFESISYWSAWTISLMVTISNGFLQLFSLDKNYFEYAITTEQLKTEGWQFFQLSGKYEDYKTHEEAYKSFSKSVENIKRKQVEKEFSGKGDVNKGKGGKKTKEFDFQKDMDDRMNQFLKKMEEGQHAVENKKVDGVVKDENELLYPGNTTESTKDESTTLIDVK